MDSLVTKIKNGFTLAEVLITLVVIGVIAALTIPNVINNMQREELHSQFKKTISVTSQAVQKMKIDYGDLIFDTENDTPKIFRDKFINYFSVSCKDNCIDASKYKNYTNSVNASNAYFSNSFIAQDGAAYGFFKGDYSLYLYITVDINGLKGPNRWGYDVFTFYISGSDIKPCDNGIPGTSIRCSDSYPDLGSNGAGCTAKAIANANYFKNLPK